MKKYTSLILVGIILVLAAVLTGLPDDDLPEVSASAGPDPSGSSD